MPINNFSVGRDISLVIVTNNGPIQFNLMTEFKSKQDSTRTRIKGMDGKTRYVRFFDGWSGSFMVERRDNVVYNYFAQLEAAYYAGVNEQAASITNIIQEPTGSISIYRWFGVLLDLDDAGTWAGDATVKQSISWVAERMIQVQ
jgi:hypothetical protein